MAETCACGSHTVSPISCPVNRACSVAVQPSAVYISGGSVQVQVHRHTASCVCRVPAYILLHAEYIRIPRRSTYVLNVRREEKVGGNTVNFLEPFLYPLRHTAFCAKTPWNRSRSRRTRKTMGTRLASVGFRDFVAKSSVFIATVRGLDHLKALVHPLTSHYVAGLHHTVDCSSLVNKD